MKWHGLYQSVSHSVTAVVPECRLPLRPAPLPLGKSRSLPPLFGSLHSFVLLLSQLYKLPPFHSIISSPPTLARRERAEEGRMHEEVWNLFFLSFLASVAIRHKALCPLLHAPTFLSQPPLRPSFLLLLPKPLYSFFPPSRSCRGGASGRAIQRTLSLYRRAGIE